MKISISGQHLDIGEALRKYISDHIHQSISKYFPDDSSLSADVKITKHANKHGNVGIYQTIIFIYVAKSKIICRVASQDLNPYLSFDKSLSKIKTQLSTYKDKIASHNAKSTASVNISKHVLRSAIQNDAYDPNCDTIYQDFFTDNAAIAQDKDAHNDENAGHSAAENFAAINSAKTSSASHVASDAADTLHVSNSEMSAKQPLQRQYFWPCNTEVLATKNITAHIMQLSEAIMNMELQEAKAYFFINAANNHLCVLYRRADNHIAFVDTQDIKINQ